MTTTVAGFRDNLAKADAVLIVSPEYNYSIPGGLKNAIDWASRGEDSPLLGKPVAVMGGGAFSDHILHAKSQLTNPTLQA